MGLSNPATETERRSTTTVSSVSPNWVTTRLDFLINWARSNSLWPMPFGTACCAIEFMATAASRFDLARFGMERQSFSPRQADVLICAGRCRSSSRRSSGGSGSRCRSPSGRISMGACASTGGIFDNYAMVQGIDTIIPVDVYVPGCPPRPEGLIYGILLLQKKIMGETHRGRHAPRRRSWSGRPGCSSRPSRIDELSRAVRELRSPDTVRPVSAALHPVVAGSALGDAVAAPVAPKRHSAPRRRR